MPGAFPALLALTFAGAAFLSPCSAHAAATDRALLSTFCDAADISGATCKRAKHYPNAGRRSCDVTLAAERYSGRFVASGNPLLIVTYESGCEAHVTDSGGSIVFEQVGSGYVFKGFQPGMQANACIMPAESTQHDRLICLTGHIGQGILETGVAQMAFSRDAAGHISLALDMLLTAEDSNGAYGANVVTCAESSKYFELSKLAAGPRPDTVTVEASYADTEIVRTACGKGFPKPQETFGELAKGEAYVPAGYQKRGKVVIDIVRRKAEP
jgi:hypothetical protein